MPSLQHQQNSEREHASKSDRPAAPPKTSARKDGESNPPLNQETGDVIFVVDDDPDFRALLADILSDAGFRPILFNRAEGLLASLEWTIPAAIITDLVMPDLSGSQLVAVLGRSERWGRNSRCRYDGQQRHFAAASLPCPDHIQARHFRPRLRHQRTARRSCRRGPDAATAMLTCRVRESGLRPCDRAGEELFPCQRDVADRRSPRSEMIAPSHSSSTPPRRSPDPTRLTTTAVEVLK